MRALLRVLGGLALLLVLAATSAVLAIDWFAASLLESGATQAIGVRASVDSVHVSFLAGRISVDGFRLASPQGFAEGDLVSLDALRVDVPRNLLAQSIRIPELAIEGLELDLEQKGTRTNVSELLRGMQSGAGAAPPTHEQGTRELVIERLVVRDTTVRLRIGGREPIPLRIPELELRNVGGRGTREQHVAEIVRRVLTAVLKSVASNRELPAQLAAELARGLRAPGSRAVLEDLGRQAEQSAGEAVEGLRGLLRRKSE